MRIALTGASGFVGASVLPYLQQAGHQVTPLDRKHGFRLGDRPDLRGQDALIHCAFAHEAGLFRGGEGDDPAGFIKANQQGTRTLFDQARECGVARILFLSTRAVHDGYPAGMFLTDDLPSRPANLYGEVKADGEEYLRGLAGVTGTSIRATGLYGPGPGNKWHDLFRDYLDGDCIAPRIATELHVADLADAMLLLLRHPAPPPQVNASDIVLDRHDLLAAVSRLTACKTSLPERADGAGLRLAGCAALARLGWRPGGMARLQHSLPALMDLARDL